MAPAIEDLLRELTPQVLEALARRYGQFEGCEDAVQEAVLAAAVEPEYLKWLSKTLPQAAVTVWPGSGHFPHIACPGRFAECLAATAHPTGQTQGNEQRA